jgi:hypothetical protein
MRTLFFLTALAFASFVPSADVPPEWLTGAEASGYRATFSHRETVAFLERVAQATPAVRLTTFGRSAQGRDLPLVIVSPDGHFTPEAARASGRPIVLIQSCIHPGEVDGKSASLAMLRDLALGLPSPLRSAGVVLFAPIYNADGHERVSPYNRANQNGPADGMGFRATTAGLDLNRDHIKLDSVEARALAGLVSTWRPHLHVDNHVTDGSRHRWILTWSHAEAPQLAAPLDTWLSGHFPKITERLAERGHPNGPYASLLDRMDPTKGIDSSVAGPRYSTGYFALRNRISILVEMYAYAPFEERVAANRAFLEELLVEVAASGEDLVAAAEAADRITVAAGAPDAEPSEVVLRWRTVDSGDTVAFPVCGHVAAPSMVAGGALLFYECGADDPVRVVPWRHRPEAAASRARPRGYLVLPGFAAISDRVRAHGLRAIPLTVPAELEVETFRVAAPRLAERSYQGRVGVQDMELAIARETIAFPEGALWIPADQPDFELAVQLLEPDGPDSALRWGMLHGVFERKEYIDWQTLEGLANELIADPAVEAAWSQALEDPEFAADRNARYLWWYRRTPFWDDTVGLVPVMRRLEPLPSALVAPALP